MWVVLLAVLACAILAIGLLTNPAAEREFPINGSNVSELDTEMVVEKIAKAEGLENSSQLLVDADNFDLMFTSNFNWTNDGAIRFLYGRNQKYYSAQLRMFHDDNKYFITDRSEWIEPEKVFLLSHYLDALKYMPQEEIRQLSPDADGYSVFMRHEGAPIDYERVLKYSQNGVNSNDGWYIHLEVQPLHEVEGGGYNGTGDEVIHLFYNSGDNRDDIAGKTYLYDGEGFGGSFTITLYEDGTFTYYEGMLSSYIGAGTFMLDGDTVIMTDGGYGLVNHFRHDGDDLVFVEQDSDNFVYVKVKDGEKFHCTGEAFKLNDTTAVVIKWFDYLETPDEMKWDGSIDINLPEFPDVTFRWSYGEMLAVKGSKSTSLYTGMPIWNTYFCDLTGDGLPDLCSTLTFGSGMIDSRIIVYDYANGASYMLEDRGKYDYSLRLNETDGCLWIVKKVYNSDDIVASGKLLFADNCLQVAYDLKTNCESTPNTETSTSETENTLRTSDTVELIGYVGNSQTSWIELYESTDNKEPIATVPYDLIAALPGCDRKSEAFTFGYLDSITFYYGKIGAFCWCVAALPPAAGTGAANVCTSTDNGETWSISIPNALYTGTVIGAGFASEMVGFISYRYFFDNGPEIARTLDGGKTWARLELDIPEEYAQYNMQPQNPTFSGNDGNYPIILLDKDGNDRTMTLHTHDGGMTWIWPKLSAVDVS